MRNATDTGAIGFALGFIVAGAIALATLIGNGAFEGSSPTVVEPTFHAYTVVVNNILEAPFLDAEVECVVILAQTARAEVLLAGPCVTSYP